MKTTGRCHCGAIEYSAEIDENRVGLCHCRDCQIFGGTAFRVTALLDPGAFEFTKGEPRRYDKRADSGKLRSMLFCGACGTQLCSLPDPSETGGFVSLRAGTADVFSELKPVAELWCASKLPWVPELEGTVKLDTQP